MISFLMNSKKKILPMKAIEKLLVEMAGKSAEAYLRQRTDFEVH